MIRSRLQATVAKAAVAKSTSAKATTATKGHPSGRHAQQPNLLYDNPSRGSSSGLDGFWIHRVMESEGIESHVVDAASILTSRRGRRAKTDRIDGETLVRTPDGVQAWRATGVFDGQGTDAAGGGPPACLPRAPDTDGRAGEARQPDQRIALRSGCLRLRAAAQRSA
jgi:hypothetical protein